MYQLWKPGFGQREILPQLWGCAEPGFSADFSAAASTGAPACASPSGNGGAGSRTVSAYLCCTGTGSCPGTCSQLPGSGVSASAAQQPTCNVFHLSSGSLGTVWRSACLRRKTTYAPPAPKKKTGLIVGICVGGVVVIAAVVLLILWLTGVFGGSSGSPKAVAESYVSAIMQPEGVDGQAILDLLPDQLVNEAIAQGSFSSEREMAESLEYAAGTVAESLQYLEDYGISYEYTVGQGTPVSESELSSVQDAYQEYNINVGAAQTVEVVFTLSYQGETMEETIEVPVVQIGGSWYLDSYSLS